MLIHIKNLLLVILLCNFTVQVAAESESKLFYRGDYDDNKVAAENGAIVNKQYHDYIKQSGADGQKLIKVRDGVYTITGYSLANYTFIEGKTGLIAFDTGNNMGMGRDALKIIREVSDKPIKNIIYSHSHYTTGAKAYADDAKNQGVAKVNIYAHPDLDKNLRDISLTLAPMQIRRASIQLGFYLPDDGKDAYYGPAEPTFNKPEDKASGHLNVNRPVNHGQEVEIDGLKAVFYHTVSDTRDSIAVHFPELDLVLHNAAATPVAFPLYTLRGEQYRNPKDMLAGLDIIRNIKPAYLIGAHGLPFSNKQEAYDFVTTHRDLYSFIYNQSIRAINQGMTPDEMVNNISIPEHLDQNPQVFPAYVSNEYGFRGQYRGLVGWYDEDTADLHPPAPAELANVMIEGFGGAENMISAAQKAYTEKKYNLTAKLLSYVLDGAPDNNQAKQLKAKALRAMAQATRTGIQTRSFLLTHALHLEGKLDWTKPAKHSIVPPPTVESLLRMPVGTLVKVLESKIDPKKSADLIQTIGLNFTDVGKSWAIHIRQGVAEVSEFKPSKLAATLNISRETWIAIALKQLSFKQALEQGKATIEGDVTALFTVLAAFG